MTESEMIELMYDAAREPLGKHIEVSDTVAFREAFYRIRRKVGDPALKILTCTISRTDPEHHIYLWRNTDDPVDEALRDA